MTTDVGKEDQPSGLVSNSRLHQLWSVQLDLLKNLLSVCTEHGLTCYAMGGTLLGAVRHGGYIPWDDDIDVIMPRPDYDRLLALGSEAFKPPYFLQSPLSERGFWRSHVQLRNLTVRGCIPDDMHRPGCKGVFIDIFVLDGIPSPGFRRWLHLLPLRLMNKIAYLAMDSKSGYFGQYGRWGRLAMPACRAVIGLTGFRRWFVWYNRLCARYPYCGSEMVAHKTFKFFSGKAWPSADFAATVNLPFQDMSVPCPIGYDDMLTRQYGSGYREVPRVPPSTSHGKIIFEGL